MHYANICLLLLQQSQTVQNILQNAFKRQEVNIEGVKPK